MVKKAVLTAALLGAALLVLWHTATFFDPPVTHALVATPRPDSSSSPRMARAANPPAGNLQADLGKAPLPPKPLRETYPDLKARAEAGETRAACTLAFELHRCDGLPQLKKSLLEFKRRQLDNEEGSAGWKSAQWMIDRLEPQVDVAKVACEGFPQEDARDAWKYLLQAAQAGHPESLMRFLWPLGLNIGGNPLDYLDQWTAYRDYAPALLDRAVSMGLPEAYELASRMYERDFVGKSPLPRDPVKSHAFDLALARAGPADRARNAESRARARLEKGTLDAPQLARAEALAASLAPKLNATGPKLSVMDGGCEALSR